MYPITENTGVSGAHGASGSSRRAADARREVADSWAGIVMRHLLDCLYEIVLRRDWEFAELQGSILAVAWGAWLLMSYYDVARPSVAVLLRQAPNEVWGVCFLATGALQLHGLLGRRLRVRRWATLQATMLWLFTALRIGAG